MTLGPVRSLPRRAALAAASIFLLSAGAMAATPPTQAVQGTTGDFSTAVVLVTFTDNPSQPRTVAEADALVFGDVSDFLWENSYQQTLLSGDTFGWYPIPMAASNCETMAIAREADRAATAAGANLASYEQIVYMFPYNSGCGFSGTGGMNAAGQHLVFINGEAGMSTKVVSHEIGHRFELFHSDALDCNATPLGDTCAKDSAGDPADAMGNRLGHFNAFQKELLGWLNAGTSPAIPVVTTSGRYHLDPFETKSAGNKALKIRKGTDANGAPVHYYLEYRQLTGFDAGLANVGGNLANGVLVHTGSQGDLMTSMLLDMTPNSIFTSKSADFFDSALAAGKTFTDATAGVTISVVSVDASGATVDITVSGAQQPTPPPPTGTTLTQTIGTDKTSYVRGESVAMSALVKRNGVVSSGATVKFTVTTPTGGTTVLNATSGSDGFARATYRSGKAKNAVGTYALRAEASQSGTTATASATFGVR